MSNHSLIIVLFLTATVSASIGEMRVAQKRMDVPMPTLPAKEQVPIPTPEKVDPPDRPDLEGDYEVEPLD